jgi:hypothetical protein
VPPPSAHLYLAQLSEGDPRLALKHYQAAIEIFSAQLKGKDRALDDYGRNNEVELKGNIVRAFVGQVEIWMDPSYDLWYAIIYSNCCIASLVSTLSFEPNAEKTCEDLLSLALQTDPENPEALQALASVRMSQQRPDDAKSCLERAWSAWKNLELGT